IYLPRSMLAQTRPDGRLYHPGDTPRPRPVGLEPHALDEEGVAAAGPAGAFEPRDRAGAVRELGGFGMIEFAELRGLFRRLGLDVGRRDIAGLRRRSCRRSLGVA